MLKCTSSPGPPVFLSTTVWFPSFHLFDDVLHMEGIDLCGHNSLEGLSRCRSHGGIIGGLTVALTSGFVKLSSSFCSLLRVWVLIIIMVASSSILPLSCPLSRSQLITISSALLTILAWFVESSAHPLPLVSLLDQVLETLWTLFPKLNPGIDSPWIVINKTINTTIGWTISLTSSIWCSWLSQLKSKGEEWYGLLKTGWQLWI